MDENQKIEDTENKEVIIEESKQEKPQEIIQDKTEEAVRQKSKTPVFIAIIFGVITLTIALIAFVFINYPSLLGIKSSENNDHPSRVESSDDLNIDINSPLVQNTITPYLVGTDFSLFSAAQGIYREKSTSVDDLDEVMLLDFAFLRASFTDCKIPKDKLISRYGNYDPNMQTIIAMSEEDWNKIITSAYEKGCLDMKTGRENIKKMFGVDIELSEGENYRYYRYSKDYDELYHPSVGGRGGVPSITVHNLIKADKYGKKLYIYESVARANPDGTLSTWECYSKGEKCTEYYRVEGLHIADTLGDIDVNVAVDYLKNNTEKFEIFKWTFIEEASGNYVFLNIEKIED